MRRILIALAFTAAAGLVGGFLLALNLVQATGSGAPISLFNPAPCAARIERTLAFTAPDAQDTLIVQSSGPSCQNLVANVTIRTPEGKIVFAHAARIDKLMDPKLNPMAVNGVKAVLEDYAALADGGARAALPDWSDSSGPVGGPYASITPISGAMLYRRVREAGAPLLRLRESKDSGGYYVYLPELDDSEQIARYAL
ncbi:MAG: hypothetical protein AB7M12_05010 [Hyphomonadaceae bacterium]